MRVILFPILFSVRYRVVMLNFCVSKPIRFLRVELKKYLVRHGHLSNEPEWKSVLRSYGLRKGDESNVAEVDSGSVKANTTDCVDEEIQGHEVKDEHEELEKDVIDDDAQTKVM